MQAAKSVREEQRMWSKQKWYLAKW